MLDLQPLFEFSRQNCVAICSFLVPAILLTTIATLVLVATGQSLTKMRWSRGMASVLAIALFLHVSTWFMIGIITPRHLHFVWLGFNLPCRQFNSGSLS